MLIKNKKWKNYLLATLALFVLILLFEIYPRVSNILTLGYDLYKRNAKTEEAEQNNLNESNLITENKKLKLQINSFVSNYEESQKISSIISFLDDLAARNDVEVTEIVPGKVEKKNNLRLQPIEININSNYEGMFNFVRSLEKSSKVIVLKELDFKPIRPISDSLNVKANLEVYLNL
jgi:Tfp pilus assembly protein PilO